MAKQNVEILPIGMIGLFVVIAALLVSVVLQGYVIVPAGFQGVLKTFGAVDTVLSPGFHLKIPFVQDVTLMETRTVKYEAEATAATKDLLDVTTRVALNYHLEVGAVGELYQTVGSDYQERIIVPAVQETVKAVTAKFDAAQLITDRPSVKQEIDEQLATRLAKNKIIVDTISLTDFKYPKEFNDAIISKQTAVQLKQKAENDLLRIEVEAKQARTVAEGQANAKIEIAMADARAIELINEQLEKSPAYIQFKALDKWNGVLPLVTGGAVPFVPLNISEPR